MSSPYYLSRELADSAPGIPGYSCITRPEWIQAGTESQAEIHILALLPRLLTSTIWKRGLSRGFLNAAIGQEIGSKQVQ